MSSSNTPKKTGDDQLAREAAFQELLKAAEVARSLGLPVHLYKYPHGSTGGKVIFHYFHEHTTYFLLHTRSEVMTLNPGKIDAAGGYFNEDKHSEIVESTKDEVLQEHGQAFYDGLIDVFGPDFIRLDNVADKRCGIEPNPFYLEWGMDVKEGYSTDVWYVKITKDLAELAIAGDHEVDKVIHLPVPEIHKARQCNAIVPDIYDTIMLGMCNGKIS